MKSNCIICKQLTEGRGHYTFRYLDERVILCGHHAQKVMKFIKQKAGKK